MAKKVVRTSIYLIFALIGLLFKTYHFCRVGLQQIFHSADVFTNVVSPTVRYSMLTVYGVISPRLGPFSFLKNVFWYQQRMCHCCYCCLLKRRVFCFEFEKCTCMSHSTMIIARFCLQQGRERKFSHKKSKQYLNFKRYSCVDSVLGAQKIFFSFTA